MTVSPIRAAFEYDIFQRVDPSEFRVSQRNGAWPVAEAEIVCIDAASDNELVTNAIDWINDYVMQSTGRKIAVRTEPTGLPALYVGFGDAAKRKFESLSSEFSVKTDPGPQGFIVRQVGMNGKKALFCWSPTALGCRYGLIEFLRSLKTVDGQLVSEIENVVDAPDFPVRIHYVNFAEHLQNAYNVNVLFESEINRWTLTDWERYIDMISAYRYNIFEFWLAPTLMGTSAEARDSVFHRNFVETINHVISYAKRRGVSVHPLVTVNTLGGEWLFACPNDPKEKQLILDAWEFWTKSIRNYDSFCVFPGDPGGCTRNGCTKETYIDLALELSRMIQRNNPGAVAEVGTWGEPFSGWGIPLWASDRELAERSMEYLLKKLPEFPEKTFCSINRGFNPDSHPEQIGHGGGDGRPYARRASELVPVLTWDYSVSEGEGTVSPRCRIRRMIEIRKDERALGCYSGGICYTMAPQVQCLSAFCSAETWWNPDRPAEEILSDFGRWTFGDGCGEIGRLLEEFEVIPDWGYYAPFPYSAQRLHDAMIRLNGLMKKVDTKKSPRLPIAIPLERYCGTLVFFTELFRGLADVSLGVDALDAAFRKTSFAKDSPSPVSLSFIQDILATHEEFDGRNQLQSAAVKLLKLDIESLKQRYWNEVYGIYDHIVAPVDPRAEGATSALFNRFNVSLAVQRKPCVLEEPLRATGKPYLLFPLGGASIRGWTMTGWDVQGDNGEVWSACMREGVLKTDSFKDEGFRWLVLRIADGKAGEKKLIWINGQKIGEFVRTGPPDAREWFVTRSYPIPEGLLKDGALEIKFTEPGVGIAGVALSREEIQPTP